MNFKQSVEIHYINNEVKKRRQETGLDDASSQKSQIKEHKIQLMPYASVHACEQQHQTDDFH